MFNAVAWSPDAIWSAMQTAFWFLIMLGPLVTFHELGHFLAARLVGVRVLKFSIGFGPKLVGRQLGETEYLVSAVPLGGYVKLFGEEEADALTPEEKRRSFVHQALSSKMLIVAAGPIFNFVLAYLIFTGWLATGAPLFVPTFRDLSPDVETLRSGSPAEVAGIQVGDRILRVNDRDISTRNELVDAVATSKGRPLALEIRRGNDIKTVVVTPEPMAAAEGGREAPSYSLGTEDIAPVITSVMAGMPGMAAGLQPGDRVIRIDDRPIYTWTEMTAVVKKSPGRPLRFEVKRDGATITVTVTPMRDTVTVNGQPVEYGKIGISGPGRLPIHASTPLSAAWHGVEATWGWTELTVVGIYKMIAGEISSKNIGGPLTIANISREAAAQGPSSFVFLIAILSINLGVINLIPIPILDGGHLLFFTIEGILRRPLSDRQREIAQQVGVLLIVCIMVFALWNDFQRLLSQ